MRSDREGALHSTRRVAVDSPPSALRRSIGAPCHPCIRPQAADHLPAAGAERSASFFARQQQRRPRRRLSDCVAAMCESGGPLADGPGPWASPTCPPRTQPGSPPCAPQRDGTCACCALGRPAGPAPLLPAAPPPPTLRRSRLPAAFGEDTSEMCLFNVKDGFLGAPCSSAQAGTGGRAAQTRDREARDGGRAAAPPHRCRAACPPACCAHLLTWRLQRAWCAATSWAC